MDIPFREICLVDFEFVARPGERSVPVCAVFHELRSGQTIRLWQDDLRRMRAPPFTMGAETLYVAFYASAELGCHLALGWALPVQILDLYAEFRAMTSGLTRNTHPSLLHALVHFGLDAIGAQEKAEMRNLIMRGGPWTEAERLAILDYCESDVDALRRLLPAMLPGILKQAANPAKALGQALLRGRFFGVAAEIEWTGVPLDAATLSSLREHWEPIKALLVTEVDARYGVFEGTRFSAARFAHYLQRRGIPWPHLESGRLDLKDETFHDMALVFPELEPIRALRHALSQLRLNSLAVGADGRNRYLISPFGALTSRNTPSSSKSIFGPAVWLRSLVKPPPEYGLAYVDFTSQEVGIAAALSGDANLIAAYKTGDVYLGFARQAGIVPAKASRASHPDERERCKAIVLGVQYGMGPPGFAQGLGISLAEAKAMLELHRRTYPRFWTWSDAAVDTAMLTTRLDTVFGWPVHVGPDVNTRSLRNFPMQANGAEMLRLALSLAVGAGLGVCAPIHDAILIEAPLERLDQDAAVLQQVMAQASAAVLNGFEIRTEAKLVRAPDRYVDPRGVEMWNRVMRLLAAQDGPVGDRCQRPGDHHHQDGPEAVAEYDQ